VLLNVGIGPQPTKENSGHCVEDCLDDLSLVILFDHDFFAVRKQATQKWKGRGCFHKLEMADEERIGPVGG
jgi:hypothetical protein